MFINSNTKSLSLLIMLFFMWGFITCLNDILIPYLKNIFGLSYFKAMLVQFAFFGAYFTGSLIYLTISVWRDPISIIGYKNGIIVGLLISSIGCFMFYPASQLHSYPIFLLALFVLGLGFTVLQITANPFVAIIGGKKGSSASLNLAQGFNSFGTTIAPIIGGYFIFHFFNKWGEPIFNNHGQTIITDSGETLTAMGVQIPYLIFALIFAFLAIVFYMSQLPTHTNKTDVVKGLGVLKHKHLLLGFIAIFMYVGAEVTIGSFIINYLGETQSISEMDAKTYLSLYWGGAMIGRFLGAISLSDKYSNNRKMMLMILVAFFIFSFIYGILYIESGISIEELFPYLAFICLNLLFFYFSKSSPSKAITLFALISIIMLLIAILFPFSWTMWCIISIGLFNSIMWSNIFTLAIKDLGKYTAQGSSILIMAILGGAILPPLQGILADKLGIVTSFIVPLIAYIYIVFYGIMGYKSKIKADEL